ncbi:hypothetical protein B0H34DRAFT_206408 [Crassisporium funariophilum]|nr:hypothetical protein B0H34DRAFT_206408 [Crassisporium funariophilum]
MSVNSLPTEIICSIFSFSNESLIHKHHLPLPSPHVESPNSPMSDFCVLPSLQKAMNHSISLSHVCVRWRHIAVDLSTLWTRIFLNHNAFNDVHTTSNFTARSTNLPLYLDISLDDALHPIDSFEDKTAHILMGHVCRCQTLRLLGSDFDLNVILDVFLDYNISSSPNITSYTPLSHLHLMRKGPSDKITFPPDLNLVSPHLTSLRVFGAHVAAYPRWSIRNVALINTFISCRNYHHLLQMSGTRKMVLERVTIPDQVPHIRGGLGGSRPSSVTSLTFSDLQCAPGESHHREIFSTFFTISTVITLQELEIVKLNEKALEAFIAVLRVSPPLIFPELARLTLRFIRVGRMAVTAMSRSFPMVSEMVLEEVGGGATILFDAWRNDGSGVWPQLSEIFLDQKLIKRHSIH